MPLTPILNECWEAYDCRKAILKQDPKIFCPDELWEFNYLMDNILKQGPQLDPISVMLAIRQSMRETVAPRPRQYFVEIVMKSIMERETRLLEIIMNSDQNVA